MEVTPSSDASFLTRLCRRFSSYTAVGVGTFAFDLVLLWVFLSFFAIDEAWAIGVAFLVSVHINYLILRFSVYRKSTEKVQRTYPIFIIVALLFSFIIPHFVIWLNELLGLNLLLSRILIAAVIGTASFAINTFLNFKFL